MTDADERSSRHRVAATQALVAAFLSSAEVERGVRADPVAWAAHFGAPLAVAERLARLDAHRLAAFRASMRHKQDMREGKAPTRLRQ